MSDSTVYEHSMVSCPKCGSYSISGPRYIKTKGRGLLRWTCNRCGYTQDSKTKDAREGQG